MTLSQIYNLAIKMGVDSDLRGKTEVQKVLKKTKEQYQKLDQDQKSEFDSEKLINPYSDTRILFDNKKSIKKILTGIDIGTGEMLLADKLGCDAVVSHHPLGPALADLSDVMHLQAQVLAQYGVPINIAEGVLKERIEEVSRGTAPINHNRPVDTAKLLDINLVCVHTPCDNLAADFLDKFIKKTKPETVGEVVKALKQIPEYQEAVKLKAGPRIFVGAENNSAGKIVLTEITGGTEGSKEIYAKMSQAGLGTVIGMHLAEEHREEAKKAHLNVVIAGHMSSDSIGINLFLDELENRGLEVITCSGIIRIKRK
ncbi:MAG: NGG1p interacting factor NIF3 [bacterium]